MSFDEIRRISLLALVALALAVVIVAVVSFFLKKVKADSSLGDKLQKALRTVETGTGVNVETATMYSGEFVGLSVQLLSEQVRQFNDSTERLGKVNLLLTCAIALATIAYALNALV